MKSSEPASTVTRGPHKVTLSIVTPCFNESANLAELISRVRAVMSELDVPYEHIVIDNASTDDSLAILRAEASKDSSLRVIANVRNFGHIRSPYHAILQATGSCVVLLASDLQDPPEVIPELWRLWREGAPVVMLVKARTEESRLISLGRRLYYRTLNKASSSELVQDATGSGLYDRDVVEYLRSLNDPYPYLRGLVAESGFPVTRLAFDQPLRIAGKSSNNLASLYDMAMLGFTTHSRLPLRIVSLAGFCVAALSMLIGLVYLIRKLADWDAFELGLAPLAVGLFFLGAMQLIALGILGEYIGNIFLRIRGLPLVIEAERINFVDRSAYHPRGTASSDELRSSE